MMKNSAKPILSLSLAAALAFGLTSCSNDTAPDPSPSSSPSASVTSKPTTSASPTATSAPTKEPATPSTPPATSQNEVEEAQKAFPNIEVPEGANKEQAQLALYGAQKYINTFYNSGYLANGSWVKNGASSQELVKLYGKDWSDNYRAKIELLVDGIHSSDTEVSSKSSRDLMTHLFYFNNSSNFALPQSCNVNNVGAGSCLKDEKIESSTEMTYQVNKDNGSIYVNAKFTANVLFIKDNVQGVSPVQYDIQLEMIKNPYPDAENLRFAYIVNDIGGNWKIDNWQKGE